MSAAHADLSPLDDFPFHQTSESLAHVATSDRNFYDRYYFNLHHCADDLFLALGVGQYPNLGVTDAFAAVVYRGVHRVVRASRELGADRGDTCVGPFRVEVLEPLNRLRVRAGTGGVRALLRPDLDRRDPGHARAAAVRAAQRPGVDGLGAAGPDRFLGGHAAHRRGRARRHPRPPGGAPGTAPGASGRSARPSPPGSAATAGCRRRSTGSTPRCSSTTSRSWSSRRRTRRAVGCWRRR